MFKKKKKNDDDLNYINDLKKKDGNDQIMVITYAFIFVFVILIAYLFYFTAVKSEDVINNTYNSRGDIFSKYVTRGDIKARNGEVLAHTDTDSMNRETRIYPYGNTFAHVVGFSTEGNIGIEAIANFKLLTSNTFIASRIKNEINDIKNTGDTLITTLDVDLQSAAYQAMGNYKGAVVVMNSRTGEILAMVSKPDFDPNSIVEIWDSINADTENSPLLNRATAGLYPPGSTFKIVTALEYIKENKITDNYEYNCVGKFEFGDEVINCYHQSAHGEVNFEDSFAKSCNSSFANITSQLNKNSFETTCKELLFNEKIPSPFSYKKSYVDINKNTDLGDLLQAGIGQGKTMVTPFHMALITSSIANDGVLMKPYIISKIENANGDTVKKYSKEEYKRLISSEDALELQNLMKEVVEYGTGKKLRDTSGYIAAGKTGSAEYTTDKRRSHAWFTGYAPIDNPEIVVTVILEDGGSGGENAVPVARAVFDEYFN